MTTAAPLNPTHASTFTSPAHAPAAASSRVPRGPVTATLHFYDPPADGAAPYNWVDTQPEGVPQRNFGAESHEVEIADARGQESSFSLDKQAFSALQGVPHDPSIDWDDDAAVKSRYYPQVEQVLLAHTPGSPRRVLIFDHTVRRANPAAPRAPVTRCHIDQTAKSAAARVRFHLPDEADALLQGRYRIINVWRPLNGAVESSPLAFADSATVPDGDMVGVEHRYPDRTGETAAVKFSAGQKWYYLSGIGDDERLLLQCFDSWQPSNRVPHSAFVDPRNGEDAKPRESIEVRALVFG